MTLAFFIPGPPCAKGRPRIGMRGGHAMAYTDSKTARYENLVALCAREKHEGIAHDRPVAVTIRALFDRPLRLKARSKKDGRLLIASEGRMPHTSRPDLDNIVKAVLDGMNSAGIWVDDSQVDSIHATKQYVAMSESAGVEVIVEWSDE